MTSAMSTQPSEPSELPDDVSARPSGPAPTQPGEIPGDRSDQSGVDATRDTSTHDQDEDVDADTSAEPAPGSREPESAESDGAESHAGPGDAESENSAPEDAEPSHAATAGTTPKAPPAQPEPAKKPITGKTIFKMSLTVAIISGILEFIFARQIDIGLFAFAIAFVALILGFGAMMLVERRIDRLGEDDESFPRL